MTDLLLATGAGVVLGVVLILALTKPRDQKWS